MEIRYETHEYLLQVIGATIYLAVCSRLVSRQKTRKSLPLVADPEGLDLRTPGRTAVSVVAASDS
jgi:hypothetical protein